MAKNVAPFGRGTGSTHPRLFPGLRSKRISPTAPTAESSPLLTLLREDLESHGGDWSRPGFQALAVYRFGVWRMHFKNGLIRRPLSAAYRAFHVLVRNIYGIELPYSAKVGRRVVIEHQGGIVIHGNAVVGDGCVLRQGVTLGSRCVGVASDAPILGKGIQVGAGAVILGRVRVGDGSSVGANAVVINDVPPGATVVGVPARPVLRRTID